MDIQVAISQDFLTAIVRLPRAQQKKVNQFVSKFRNDPLATGINYEKINDAANSDMRSVRIDQAYRGIVLKPRQGNVRLFIQNISYAMAILGAYNNMADLKEWFTQEMTISVVYSPT